MRPEAEEGFVPLDSITARIYSVPLTVFIGGVAAVILELGEPRVRHGVWDHSVFPTDPVLRLRRTGLAAMVSFYGARSVATRMIEGINARHATIEGWTDKGVAYRATDPDLLRWVQGTAAFGFISAYDRYADRLTEEDWDAALSDAVPVAKAYGVADPPDRKDALLRLIRRTAPLLEPSETLLEFLAIISRAPALPGAGRRLQPLFVRAAVSLLPAEVVEAVGLENAGLRAGERQIVRTLVRASRLTRLRNHPAALAKLRLSKPRATV